MSLSGRRRASFLFGGRVGVQFVAVYLVAFAGRVRVRKGTFEFVVGRLTAVLSGKLFWRLYLVAVDLAAVVRKHGDLDPRYLATVHCRCSAA